MSPMKGVLSQDAWERTHWDVWLATLYHGPGAYGVRAQQILPTTAAATCSHEDCAQGSPGDATECVSPKGQDEDHCHRCQCGCMNSLQGK